MRIRIDRVKLATEMTRREWRYKKLSELSGISRATISAIVGGKAVADRTAQSIAKALNVPITDLLETRED